MEENLWTGLYGAHKTLVASPPCSAGAGSTQDNKNSQETGDECQGSAPQSHCCLWEDGLGLEQSRSWDFTGLNWLHHYYPIIQFLEEKSHSFPCRGWRICPTQTCKQFWIPPCAEEWVITNPKPYWALMHHPRTTLISSKRWEEPEEAFLPRKSLWEQKSWPGEAPVVGWGDPVPKQTAPASAESPQWGGFVAPCPKTAQNCSASSPKFTAPPQGSSFSGNGVKNTPWDSVGAPLMMCSFSAEPEFSGEFLFLCSRSGWTGFGAAWSGRGWF